MRIAILTDTFDEINGVTNTYRQLVYYCRQKNIQLEVFCPSQKFDSVHQKGSVKIHRIKQTLKIPIYSDLNFDLKIISPYIENYFRHNRFDVIHASSPGNMGIQAITLSYYHRLPLVGVYHTALPEYAGKMALKLARKIVPSWKDTGVWEHMTWDVVKRFYNKCDLVLAPSEHTKNVLEEKLKTEVRIFSRGIDLDRFNPAFRQKRRGINVLYVGRMSIEKGIDDLVYAFQNIDGANLILVGDGPFKKEIESDSEDNIIFKGFMKGKDLSIEYASADFFVFPSKTDTFGNVVLEAMASGLPVIVTDQMAPKELVENGKNGFVVKNKKEMKDRIELLINDEKLRKRMGLYSRKLVEKRTWDEVFKKLFEDYEYVKDNFDYSRKFKPFDLFKR